MGLAFSPLSKILAVKRYIPHSKPLICLHLGIYYLNHEIPNQPIYYQLNMNFHTSNLDLRNSIFPFLNRELFDLRKNLRTESKNRSFEKNVLCRT